MRGFRELGEVWGRFCGFLSVSENLAEFPGASENVGEFNGVSSSVGECWVAVKSVKGFGGVSGSFALST